MAYTGDIERCTFCSNWVDGGGEFCNRECADNYKEECAILDRGSKEDKALAEEIQIENTLKEEIFAARDSGDPKRLQNAMVAYGFDADEPFPFD